MGISLSTKQLEPEPGAMVKNPQMVYDQAEEMAAKFREKMMAPQGGETAVETPEVGEIAEATEAPEGVATAEALEAPEEVATSEALKAPEEVITSEALEVPEELATEASQKTEETETTVEIAIVDEETSAAALE